MFTYFLKFFIYMGKVQKLWIISANIKRMNISAHKKPVCSSSSQSTVDWSFGCLSPSFFCFLCFHWAIGPEFWFIILILDVYAHMIRVSDVHNMCAFVFVWCYGTGNNLKFSAIFITSHNFVILYFQTIWTKAINIHCRKVKPGLTIIILYCIQNGIYLVMYMCTNISYLGIIFLQKYSRKNIYNKGIINTTYFNITYFIHKSDSWNSAKIRPCSKLISLHFIEVH